MVSMGVVDYLLIIITFAVCGGIGYFLGDIVFEKIESTGLAIIAGLMCTGAALVGFLVLYTWGLSVGTYEPGESHEYNLVCADSDVDYNLVCANSNINNGIVASSDSNRTKVVTIENGYIFHEYVRKSNKESTLTPRDSYIYYIGDNGDINQVSTSYIKIDPEIKNPTKVIVTTTTAYMWGVIPTAGCIFEIAK